MPFPGSRGSSSGSSSGSVEIQNAPRNIHDQWESGPPPTYASATSDTRSAEQQGFVTPGQNNPDDHQGRQSDQTTGDTGGSVAPHQPLSHPPSNSGVPSVHLRSFSGPQRAPEPPDYVSYSDLPIMPQGEECISEAATYFEGGATVSRVDRITSEVKFRGKGTPARVNIADEGLDPERSSVIVDTRTGKRIYTHRDLGPNEVGTWVGGDGEQAGFITWGRGVNARHYRAPHLIVWGTSIVRDNGDGTTSLMVDRP